MDIFVYKHHFFVFYHSHLFQVDHQLSDHLMDIFHHLYKLNHVLNKYLMENLNDNHYRLKELEMH